MRDKNNFLGLSFQVGGKSSFWKGGGGGGQSAVFPCVREATQLVYHISLILHFYFKTVMITIVHSYRLTMDFDTVEMFCGSIFLYCVHSSRRDKISSPSHL